MKCNVGRVDRIIRIVLGAALIAATLMGHLGVWGWLGLIPLVSGLIGYCPAYHLCGKSSCCSKEDKS